MDRGYNAEEKLNIMYEDSLKDMRNLTTRMEEVATTITAAANAINNKNTVLRGDNEKLLMSQVKAITAAVNDLKGMNDGMQLAASGHIHALLAPVIQQMHIQVKELSNKDTYASKFLTLTREAQVETGKIQAAMINKLATVAVLFGALIIGAFAAGRWLH